MPKKEPEGKINVFHVIDSAGLAGGERYVLDLIRHSNERHCALVSKPGPFEKALKARDIPYFHIGMSRKFSPATLISICSVIRQERIDIVHSHGYRSNFYSRLACLATGRVHICTIHVSLFDYIDTFPLMRKLYIFVEKMLSGVTSKFICISRAMMEDAIKLGVPENKICAISNGVDLNRFSTKNSGKYSREALGLNEGCFVIGTVGRMVSEKGQIYLLEALRELRLKGTDNVKCLFIGTGPLENFLKTRSSQYGLDGVCQFLGSRTDIEYIYPLLDLFVLPSPREPFGLVILEAMATGVPVVCVSSGGPLDIIEEDKDGFLVPPRDAEALAEKITCLMENRTLAGNVAQTAVIKAAEFDLKIIIPLIDAVYRDLYPPR